MIDLNHLENYKENNRIEAKKALGGLPHSIWETYSAFANTLGGLILLGVEESRDKTLHAVDLPAPERLVNEFWDLVNNPNKASANVLSSQDVMVEHVDGKRIIVIRVPRASRFYKPVYVDGNPLNSYRRNGEGDYKCSPEELRAMMRDAAVKTQDMIVLEELTLDVFNAESVRAYRQRMQISRPGHVWEDLPHHTFLQKIGAAAVGLDEQTHPTGAGLLMFGNEPDIVREYPQFFLDYREEYDDTHRWTDRFASFSGDWSGNLFDFYYRVYNKLQLDLKVPFEMQDGFRVDDTPVHKAIREALANCLVNADYYGRGGVVILNRRNEITMSNPGNFRIDISAAKNGGFSDPRNSAILKLFNLIDIGERAGSGIPNIFRVWREHGWVEPVITQSFEPDRTTLLLTLSPTNGVSAIKIGDKKVPIKAIKRQMIIDYLTDHVSATSAEISKFVGLRQSRVRDYLAELLAEGIISAEGANRNRRYRLKS